MDPAMLRAFADETVKIAASFGRFAIPQSRSGRRPMRVDTLLRKEKEGTLYKEDVVRRRKKERWGPPPTKDDSEAMNRMDGRGEIPTLESGRAALSELFSNL